uniref:Uncharacterized protein n=1 Tax=Arundo donax TaxID=35708 RepID=A0A0A8Y8G7_ARUDO
MILCIKICWNVRPGVKCSECHPERTNSPT